ncbi:MAG: UDP-N-acetylmuramoylalanyl-D-glutamyl-2,6-diaminopimelate--D-alanyl-D-alanine ligase [Phyllobacteriaceae bacterium]|nr:UDP-N-acetylmuramoylalanyl-D-glutamyl-2,6-diaminopimelate--D-alanyl-D-alanine ligase [Phyllobacteriaceae bacterium]
MSAPLWTGEAILATLDGRPVGVMPGAATGVSIDTRTLQSGDAYFAIKGEVHDGHDFASAALAAGASVLVVAEEKLPALGRVQAPMIVVSDTLKALERLGAAARARAKGRIVAVTGSAGKTTTKEALRHVLSAFGSVHASDRSFNNHWGVPLTLARLPADADFGIFEIGMNHPGEIRPLVNLVRPHVAIVTLIAAAHLGYFASLDEIAMAKAEIFEGIEPEGVALINRDDAFFTLLDKAAKAAGVKTIHGFGEHLRARFRLVTAEPVGDGTAITARIAGKDLSATVGAPGRHMVQNALAVLGVADALGLDTGRAAQGLAGLTPEKGRGQRTILSVRGGNSTLIDESYNANPASMRAAVALLDQAAIGAKGRRIAVLGDMRELGAHSDKLHVELAAVLAASKTDVVFLAGPEMKALAAALKPGLLAAYRESVEDLTPLVVKALEPGDAIMIKSSNGIGFSRIVAALQDKFRQEGRAA